MRISILDSDSGYANYLRLVERLGGAKSLIQVIYDGKPVRHCFTADEELGEVLIFLMDGNNRIKLDDSGAPVSRWLFGSVKILIEGEDNE